MRIAVTILVLCGLGFGCTLFPCRTKLDDTMLRSLPVLPTVTFHHDERTTAGVGVCIRKNFLATTPHKALTDADMHAVAGVGARLIAQARFVAMWDDWAVKWAPDICKDEWVDMLNPAIVLHPWQKFWIVGIERISLDKTRTADERIKEYLDSDRKVILPCVVVPDWMIAPRYGKGFKINVVQAFSSYTGPLAGLSGSVAVVWDPQRERFRAFGLFFGDQSLALGRVLLIRRLNFGY
jgi:hypothetical protein